MLKIENLTKTYGNITAVNNFSLEVEKGSIYGFVGPNGAGKTTIMKIAATLLAPTSGKVMVDGIDVTQNPYQVRKIIGYMPDFFGVYDDLKVHEYLEFYSAAHGIPALERKGKIDELLELVDLSDKKDVYVDSLSRGMKQKLCLARALAHEPKLLILDEPASGLDPRARIEIKLLLRELKEMGKTILISSHILPELAEICTHIGIIENGNLVITGDVEEINSRLKGEKIIKLKLLDKLEEAVEFLKEQPLITSIHQKNGGMECGYKGTDEELSKLLKEMVLKDIPVIYFYQGERNLEDIFLKVTKGGAFGEFEPNSN